MHLIYGSYSSRQDWNPAGIREEGGGIFRGASGVRNRSGAAGEGIHKANDGTGGL